MFSYEPSLNSLSLMDTITTSHKKTIRSVSFSPDGSLIAAASFDGTVSIHLLSDGIYDCVNVIEGHESEVKSIEWHPTKMLLATCGRDKSVWVWDYNEDFEFSCLCVINAHSQDVKQVRWIPGSDKLASSSYDETIKIWASEDVDDDMEYYCTQTLKVTL
jgi:WD40 repeat protein